MAVAHRLLSNYYIFLSRLWIMCIKFWSIHLYRVVTINLEYFQPLLLAVAFKKLHQSWCQTSCQIWAKSTNTQGAVVLGHHLETCMRRLWCLWHHQAHWLQDDVVKHCWDCGESKQKGLSPVSDKVRTSLFLAGLQRSIDANPVRPMFSHANKHNVCHDTISKSVKDLGMTSHDHLKKLILTAKTEALCHDA